MRPAREVTPASVDELAAAVRRAAEDGMPVKAVGTGHSFTSIAATDGLLVRPGLLTGTFGLACARGELNPHALSGTRT